LVVGGIPADNAGGTVGGKGGGGCAGGSGRLVRSEPERGGELDRIACQAILIGARLDEEKGTSPISLACEAVAGSVGREGVAMDEEDEACCCVLGEIGLGILFDDCRFLIELTSVKLDVRGSRLVLEFCGDPAGSGMEEAILSRLVERNGDLERENERLRRCLEYPESRRNPGLSR
jgi:hypothetical protein